MREHLLNILSEGSKDIDNQKLMDYISGKLSEEEKHEVEKWMADHPLVSEAIEGLQHAGNEKSSSAVDQLNKQLRKQLQQRKRKRSSKLLPANFWTYVAVIVILMIAVVVYLVVKLKA